ncbi:hypothetical protein BATDEDRAFT_88799 [Batrachochytrium dendrobatidis JAM81]|uniref:Uncharacterized protein n=1 Tax=Batrachochytrium dendrobatidis (strain JAM81 / FGSC 10211) TaxID=684364 RepID=F4P332_BATDJ|nr:uncharacterized protein BATDEDRAFT_88799 [Batrachochytrium dendrobatidis JAM81]EGF80412.1 hypothetical protein BATDEDRAFT_88799 [Batrachochytrium dendrobatidis JAM81]KAJ8326527.1 hypothetical protein O5D80_005273 [Batrachochytrium dendrobatidis]KAK5666684.1 hypothetical protein QVD99_006746 [Batrachochytrium dendrobatidis]|eukprot:XP_006679277.1 hypothetical protein BATDEDRAFT_88799 [Batrachochytrium dendrobatidis JAM81]
MATMIPQLQRHILSMSTDEKKSGRDRYGRTDSLDSLDSLNASSSHPLKPITAKSDEEQMDSTVTLMTASADPTPRPSTYTEHLKHPKAQWNSQYSFKKDIDVAKADSHGLDHSSTTVKSQALSQHPLFSAASYEKQPPHQDLTLIHRGMTALNFSSELDIKGNFLRTINLGAVEKLANALLRLELDEADALLCRLPRIAASKHLNEHRTIISGLYCGLLENILALHSAARQQAQHQQFSEMMEHLAAIAHDLFEYIISHDIIIDPKLIYAVADHLRFSRYFTKAIFRILSRLQKDQWTDACYSWSLASSLLKRPVMVIASENRISASVQHFLSKSYVSPKKIEQEVSSIITAMAEGNLYTSDGRALSPDNRAKLLRWTRLRLKFEEVWRWYVRVLDVPNWNNDSELDLELLTVKENALGLLADILVVARSYNEYDYAWYIFETSVMSDRYVFATVMGVCRDAFCESSNTDTRDIWEARAWALYRKSSSRHDSHPYQFDEGFLLELVQLVIEMKNQPIRLRHLDRIFKDIESQCTLEYFPITEKLLKIIIQQCWETVDLHARAPEWNAVFNRIFSIYSLSKHLCAVEDAHAVQDIANSTAVHHSTPHSIRSSHHPNYLISDPTFVTLLQICTVSGHFDEFKLLNQDLPDRAVANEDSMANVKRGFAAYLGYYVIESEDRTELLDNSSLPKSKPMKAESESDENFDDVVFEQDVKTARSYGFVLMEQMVSILAESVEGVIIKELCT